MRSRRSGPSFPRPARLPSGTWRLAANDLVPPGYPGLASPVSLPGGPNRGDVSWVHRSFVSALSMRSSIIGLVVGAVLGVVLGVTVIAPRLQRADPHIAAKGQTPAPAASDIAKQL